MRADIRNAVSRPGMSKQTVAKKDVEDFVASVGIVDLPVEVANTDDVDTAEIQPARDYDSGFGARTLASRSGMNTDDVDTAKMPRFQSPLTHLPGTTECQASWPLEVERLRKELAT